ncbi:hypothetical protein Tco_1468982 [Tanacetum coccineum]
MSSSIVTYTSVYSDSEPWRFQWVSDIEPQSPKAAPQAPPSPDYVPGPKNPPSPDYIPGTEYPEYLVPYDDEDDPKEDPADYPDDDDDDDDEEEEEEESSKEHLAPADPTPPRSPQTRIRPHTPLSPSNKAIIAEFASAPTPPSPPPFPLSPLSSLLPRIPSPPLHISLTYAEAPLGYRASMFQWIAASPLLVPSPSLLLPSSDHRDDIPESVMLLRKRARFTTLASGFEVGESSTAAAARQTGMH